MCGSRGTKGRSIEVGKLADLAVLSADVLDPVAVPDEAIKRVTSILTIVGGRIVHDAHVLPTTVTKQKQ
jgi:predicted amidohydrolase YtcJ